MSITIKDISRETNLAVSTISKYINGGNVRTKNAKAIEAAIAKLGYRPNIMAQSLRNSRSYTVGIIVPTMNDPFCSKLVEQIEQMLQLEGYSCALCCYHSKTAIRENTIEFLLQKNVDAILFLADYQIQSKELYIPDTRVPLIILNRYLEGIPADFILPDIAGGIYTCTEYLIKHQHKKIALMTACRQNDSEDNIGYRRAHEDYHLTYHEDYTVHSTDRFLALLNSDTPPDSLIISDYQLYTDAVSTFFSMGLEIPDEFSLIACDNSDFGQIMMPPITVLDYPIKEIVNKTIRILSKRLNGDFSAFPCLFRLKTQLHVRDSVLDCR